MGTNKDVRLVVCTLATKLKGLRIYLSTYFENRNSKSWKEILTKKCLKYVAGSRHGGTVQLHMKA